jgi:hypothetical protein
MSVKQRVKLRQSDARKEFFVERIERKAKTFAKFLQQQFRFSVMAQDYIRRIRDRAEVVGQRARPIENQIAQHVSGKDEEIRPAEKQESLPAPLLSPNVSKGGSPSREEDAIPACDMVSPS